MTSITETLHVPRVLMLRRANKKNLPRQEFMRTMQSRLCTKLTHDPIWTPRWSVGADQGFASWEARGRRVTARDNRRFVEAVVYRYRAGIPWRDLPDHFGDWVQPPGQDRQVGAHLGDLPRRNRTARPLQRRIFAPALTLDLGY